MKKVVMFSFILLSAAMLLMSCSSKTKDNSKNTTKISTDSSSKSKTFTVDELKKYDGKNGNPAYVAVNGTVYDVTNAKRWNNGEHVDGIVAGVDLTSKFSSAPHGDEVLKDLPIVGTLK